MLLFAANSAITLLCTALHLHRRNDGCAVVALMFLFFHATFVGSVRVTKIPLYVHELNSLIRKYPLLILNIKII